jgi:hypothetical protein
VGPAAGGLGHNDGEHGCSAPHTTSTRHVPWVPPASVTVRGPHETTATRDVSFRSVQESRNESRQAQPSRAVACARAGTGRHTSLPLEMDRKIERATVPYHFQPPESAINFDYFQPSD